MQILERKTTETIETNLNERFSQAEWSLARRLEQAQASSQQQIAAEYEKREQLEILKIQRDNQQMDVQIGEITHRLELSNAELHRVLEKRADDVLAVNVSQVQAFEKQLQEAAHKASQERERLEVRLAAAEKRLQEVDGVSDERHAASEARHRAADQRASEAEARATEAEARADASLQRALEVLPELCPNPNPNPESDPN